MKVAPNGAASQRVNFCDALADRLWPWTSPQGEKSEYRMVVLKRRSVLVTFRVSAEEHEGLKQACLKCGARSIADFARASALQKVHTVDTPEGNLGGDLMSVTEALRHLDTILADTQERIRAVLGPVGRNGDDRSPMRRAAGGEAE